MLAGVRLEVDGDHLDGHRHRSRADHSARPSRSAASDGAAVVPARLVATSSGPCPPARCESSSTTTRSISAGRSQFSVRPLPLDDYPRWPSPPRARSRSPAACLADALRQVVRAASHRRRPPVLTGVLLAAEDDGLRLVATDSYRLAVRDLPRRRCSPPARRCWCPAGRSTSCSACWVTPRSSRCASASATPTFEVGGTRLTTRLIEGEFPNYRHLIPASTRTGSPSARQPLLEAIRRVKLLARDATPVRLRSAATPCS